jgi:release factor glutamine methyltransferase
MGLLKIFDPLLFRILDRDYLSGEVLRPSPSRINLYKDHMDVGKRVLDMGTGSGVLARIALEKGAAEVVAADINPAAVEEAKKALPRAKVIQSDLFSNIEGKFDTIIFAAPWSEGTIERPGHHAIFDTGIMRKFFLQSRSHLRKDGCLWVQYSDASPKNNSAFLSAIDHAGYQISDSWSYEYLDQLTRARAKATLYKIRRKG